MEKLAYFWFLVALALLLISGLTGNVIFIFLCFGVAVMGVLFYSAAKLSPKRKESSPWVENNHEKE